MNWDLITAVIFYSVVAILIYKYRRKFEIMQKIFIVHKTQKGLDLMRKLSKFTTFWKVFSTIAIPVCVFCIFFVGKLLYENMIEIMRGTATAGVGILIPGVQIPGSPIFVPFWPGIIAIAVLAIVHEFGHGIVAAMEGIKLKATGFGFLAILPLAFVELDEEQMATMPTLSRLRILAAGAFSNITLWLVLSIVMLYTFVPIINGITVNDGLNLTLVESGRPAEFAGLTAGEMILAINNNSVLTIPAFIDSFTEVAPGDTVYIETDKGSYEIETTTHPQDESRAYVGISVSAVTSIAEPVRAKYGVLVDVFMWFFEVFHWVALLNLLVGIMNFLPIWALDGGRIVYDLLGYVIPKGRILNLIVTGIFALFLTLIIMNLIGPAIF